MTRSPEAPRRRGGPVRRDANHPSVPRPATSCDAAGRPSSTAGRRVRHLDRDGLVSPRVRREIDIATTTQTLESRCLRDQRPDCQRRDGGRRRIPFGIAPEPDPFRPHLAAGQGARQPHAAPPRTQRGRRRCSRPAAHRTAPGSGAGDVDGTILVADEVRVRLRFGLRGLGTSVGRRRRTLPEGGTVPTSISPRGGGSRCWSHP